VSVHGHFHSHDRASARRLPPGLPASIFPYEKKENSDAKRHHVIYKTKLIQNPEIFRQFLQLWLLFKVTNMFTNVFTLCDDVSNHCLLCV